MGDFILERVNSSEKIILKRDETYTYGRDKNNEIVIVDPMISRKHCVFIVSASNVKIIDSGSSNGVFLNGSQISQHTPTHVKVDDTIGIACGDLQNIQSESYVYKLKRQEKEVPQKRKLETECSEIPSKVLKTEQTDSPEIVIIDDDDVSMQNDLLNTILSIKSDIIHPSRIKQEKNDARRHSDMEIEIIDLEELESVTDEDVPNKNKPNNQQIPQELVRSNTLVLKQEYIPTNTTNHQDMEKNELESLETNLNFHFIKCEPTLLEDHNISAELSPQPSSSNIKQEITSSDFDYYNDNYSQTELICLSDDEEENFPRSQLFDESTITNIKQELTMAPEEPIDPYNEPDDIPLIELTDDENDDHEDDENTKAWLHKLLGSQLENQIIQTKVQPPEEQEEEYFIDRLEESGDEQKQVREVEYGQLNDVAENNFCEKIDDKYFLEAVGELVSKIKEFVEDSEDQEVIDSNKSNKSEIITDIKDKTKNKSDTFDNKKLKNNILTKKEKKKEKNRRSIQQSIEQSKSTSDKISNSKMIENLDNVSNKIFEKNNDCHNISINDGTHERKTDESDQHTSINKCDSHSKAKPYSVLTDNKYTKLHKRVENKRMSVDETNRNKNKEMQLHDKKSSKKEKRINNNTNEKSRNSRSYSSEEMDTTSNRSFSSYEEKSDSEIIEAFKDTSITEKSDSTIDKKASPKIGKCINIWNKKEKKIEQVDPPFFPNGGRRGVSINITATTSGTLQDHGPSSDDDIFTCNKTIGAPQKKDDRQTANDDINKKEKQMKRLRRKFGDYTPSNIGRQRLSNEEKRRIKEQRSEKLKLLQNKPDETKMSDHKVDTNKRINKPKVKVSEKNRGAFLTPDEINHDSLENHLYDSACESLVVPKIQELQQNTTAEDLYDVISGTSGSFSNDKSLNTENKIKQWIGGKENHNEIEQIDMSMNEEVVMRQEKNKKIISKIDNLDKTKPIIMSNVSIKLPNIKYYNKQCDVQKVIPPLRGILRNLQDNKTNVKKKVQFNDTTKIQMYLIDEGNRIETKCIQKDMKIGKKFLTYDLNKAKIDCPKIESFLDKVFQWKPDWLSEQQDRQIPPPIIEKKNISPILQTYSSYTNYYEIMSTLMFLETWYIMSKDYETFQRRPVLFSSVVEQSVSPIVVDFVSGLKITTFMIEALITENALKDRRYPVFGDLVMLELPVIHQGKMKYIHVFAYITALNFTPITSNTRYNIALNKYTKNPHTLITYTMMTKALPFTLQTSKPGRLKTVIYLRSHMRMVQALHYLPQSPLLEAILHPTPEAYKLPFVPDYETLTLITKDKLNKRQRESVFRISEAVVNEKPGIFLVKGPPGTGKSKVIINLITEILYGRKKNEKQKFMKILVCAPSNAAIDEIVSRLKIIRSNAEDPAYKFKMVRIGRLDAVSSTVRSFHVTELAKRDVDKTLADYRAAKNSSKSIEKQKENCLTHIKALKEEYNAEDISEMQRQHLLTKLTSFRAKYDLFSNGDSSKLLAKIHQSAENTILAGANIIACTLSSCYTNQMESIFGKSNGKISVCIVDEATQSSEPETLIPLMLGVKSLVLVGDPNQLPATVISQQAKHLGFDKSLFARIHSVFYGNPNNPVIMLDTQYRMSSRIMLFPNRYFYKGAILSVQHKERLPFHYYKVFNLSSHQDDGNKFSNTDEATFVANLIYTMATNAHKIKNLGIGIITPYHDQRILINQKIVDRMKNVPEEIKKKLTTEVNTVDSFQGQERDVVIMSCVRSNGIGFLSDRQRLCVALTRAKFSLVLCGNFKTFEKDPMWFELLKDARDRNIYINLDYKAEPETIKEFIIR